jgi:hypothetical protein
MHSAFNSLAVSNKNNSTKLRIIFFTILMSRSNKAAEDIWTKIDKEPKPTATNSATTDGIHTVIIHLLNKFFFVKFI